MDIDFDNPEVQAAVQAKIDEATNGLASKNAELLGKINDNKAKFDEMNAKLKQFDGVDMEQVSKMQKLFNESEEAKMIADGRLDEVIANKTSKVVNDANSRAEQLAKENEELSKGNASLKNQYDQVVIANKVSIAAQQAGVLPEALEDVMTRAMRTFKVTDNGGIEARDPDGNLLVGKKGEPLSANEWATKLKEIAPHYFPSSTSGGHSYTPSQAEANVLDAAKTGNMAAFRKARAKRHA